MKMLGIVAVGVLGEYRKVSGHPRIARSSLRQHSFLVKGAHQQQNTQLGVMNLEDTLISSAQTECARKHRHRRAMHPR